MTEQEYIDAQGRIAEVDTEVAALDQTIRDCIEKSREFNDARRVATGKRTAILKATEPLRNSVTQYIVEQRRIANDKARAEAEAKAAEEAKRPPQPTVAELMAKLKEMEEKLAAKG